MKNSNNSVAERDISIAYIFYAPTKSMVPAIQFKISLPILTDFELIFGRDSEQRKIVKTYLRKMPIFCNERRY